MSTLKTREREIRALREAAEELGVRRLTIVTLETEEEIRDGSHVIRVIPCRSWLAEL